MQHQNYNPPGLNDDIRLRWQMKRKTAVTSLSNPSPPQPDYLSLCKKGFADTIFLLATPKCILLGLDIILNLCEKGFVDAQTEKLNIAARLIVHLVGCLQLNLSDKDTSHFDHHLNTL